MAASYDELGVLSLGLLRPLLSTADIRQRAGRVAPDRRAWLIRRNSCTLRATRRMAELGIEVAGRTDFGTGLAAHRELIQSLVAATGRTTELIGQVANRLGVPVWCIKGAAARQWYDDPELRDLGDCDLMVADERQGFALTRALRDEGYGYEPRELPWLKFDPADSCVYGQVNLRSPDPDELLGVDVHFGGYSIRHCARSRWRPEPDEPAGLSTPDSAVTLVHLVGNAAGDLAVTVKDLNDLTLVLEREDLDWLAAVTELRRVHLLPFFRTMLRRLTKLVRLGPVAARRVADLPAGVWEPVPLTDRAGWRNRWGTTVAHAFRTGLGNSVPAALGDASTAARYYWRPLELALAGPSESPEPVAWNPRTCVRLVPLDTARALAAGSRPSGPGPAAGTDADPAAEPAVTPALSGVRFESVGRGFVVHAAGDQFIPTVDYRLAPDTVHAALAASGGR